MSYIFGRSYFGVKKIVSFSANQQFLSVFHRNFSSSYENSYPNFSNTTVFIEQGLNVQELPIVIRNFKDLSEVRLKDKNTRNAHKSLRHRVIRDEFSKCLDVADVCTILKSFTTINTHVAIGALERFCELDLMGKFESPYEDINQVNYAIFDNILNIIMENEDTETLLHILVNVEAPILEPRKTKFCDELLLRTVERQMSLTQLYWFSDYLVLMDNKGDTKCSERLEKLWLGFLTKESQINHTNIVKMFSILPALTESKKTVLTLLEQKLVKYGCLVREHEMQIIFDGFITEKYLSPPLLSVIGKWLYTKIESVNEDILLNFIMKLTKFHYTDDNIEKAIVKYVKLKASDMSLMFVAGTLNHCIHFNIRNEEILNACCDHFLTNWETIPHSLWKTYIFPFGFLYFNPTKSEEFWTLVEDIVCEKLNRLNINDISSIILSCIYLGKYPLKLVDKTLKSEYLLKLNDPDSLKKLYLIDTALSIECDSYNGPLLPKIQWAKNVTQDIRIKNIIVNTINNFISLVGDSDKMSRSVLVPNLLSDEIYMIDVMLHPNGLNNETFKWKSKSSKNANTAVLIHLPDHYSSDGSTLVGPQMMRIKHLKLLGLNVVSLNYAVLNSLHTSQSETELNNYLRESIQKLK